MSSARATAVGLMAVVLWSFLALLTVATAPMPPLQLAAISFAIGGALGLVWTAAGRRLHELRRLRAPVVAFGTAGLFGYHFLYFSALRLAPAAQAGLLAYLWPLLIVLFSGLLPGERLRMRQLAGAFLAFAGAALVIGANIGGSGPARPTGALTGYALALACALIWSAYSVISRRLSAVPTSSVALFCLLSALLAALAHLGLETTAWPRDASGWLAVALLGLGPVGLAFYVWDIGMKRGDIQFLGVASYGAPVLSTAILVAAGFARASWPLFGATLLVSGGAWLAARPARQA